MLDLLRVNYPITIIAARAASPLLEANYRQCEPEVFSDDDFDVLVANVLAKKS